MPWAANVVSYVESFFPPSFCFFFMFLMKRSCLVMMFSCIPVVLHAVEVFFLQDSASTCVRAFFLLYTPRN